MVVQRHKAGKAGGGGGGHANHYHHRHNHQKGVTNSYITPMWGMDSGDSYDVRIVDGNSKPPGEPPWRTSKFPSAMEMNQLARHQADKRTNNKESLAVQTFLDSPLVPNGSGNGHPQTQEDLDLERSMKELGADREEGAGDGGVGGSDEVRWIKPLPGHFSLGLGEVGRGWMGNCLLNFSLQDLCHT